MTEDEAFEQLAHEAFAGFGWNLEVADIPDYHNIRLSIINARDRTPDYAAQHAVGKGPTIPLSNTTRKPTRRR